MPSFWVEYHKLVTKIKTFIRAERLNNWDLHLATVADMLPTFAAARHAQYAKGGRLCLQMVEMHAIMYKLIFYEFKSRGRHTVRHIDHEWAGLWTD